MKIKNLYSVIIIILSLCHTSDIFADKSKIPTCYISPEIFDSDLNSYEDYILNKCFEKFGDHIKKGSYLSKKEFLTKIEQDKEFERFIYLYVFIQDYLFAEVGTVTNYDYTPSLNSSIFSDYIIWGAQQGNYYAKLIYSFESSTGNVDQKILDSIKDNKYYLLSSYDMGMDTYLEDAKKFFERFSVNDFEEYYWKTVYLNNRSDLESLEKKSNSEKYRSMVFDLDPGLPEGFFHQEKIASLGGSAILSFWENNMLDAKKYSVEVFNFLNLDSNVFKKNLNSKDIVENYYDVKSYLCEVTSMLFMTDAYFEHDIDFKTELKSMMEFYPKCFINEQYSEYSIGLEQIWWGLVASWYKEYDLAYDLLNKSKFPLYYGDKYAKQSQLIAPAFFNYAAISSIEKNKLNEAEEFLYHASDSYERNELPNNFQSIFSSLIKIKILLAKDKYLSAYKNLFDLREEILEQEVDFGDGYYVDEDINIFINEFLDITFKLKEIKEEYFVDPLFLFELKNLIFQSENLLNLKKNNTESDYNKKIEEYQNLRDQKIAIENKIIDSSDDDIFFLSKDLENLETNIKNIRSEILNLKSNLRFFYGSSRATYKDIQNQIGDDDIIVFYNFSISDTKTVTLDKNQIKFNSNPYGRNNIVNLINNLRSSIEINNLSSISELKEFDFKSSKILYEKLIKDLNIDTYKNIYTFSNEVINSLPLQILVSDYDDTSTNWDKYFSAEWLNKKHNFAIIETLYNEKVNKKYEKNFVGFGDPDLSNNPMFDDLPNTRNELISLAQASGGNLRDLYMRESANFENFKKAIQSNAERLVIATHAFSSNSSNLTNESGIVISSDIDGKKFVSASEIAQFDINTEWIVLSACDTGLGKLNYSKNYSSISKAFLAAGGKSVLISNWPIESVSSSLLTQNIFNNVWVNDKISKHKALNIASENLRLDMSKEYNVHPAFWGSFSIVYSSI